MEFEIEYSTIIGFAEERVSREAGQAYSADGTSLYDGIRMLSRDEDEKKRIMSEVLVSVRILCNRLVHHGDTIAGDTEEEKTSFYFDLKMSPRREAGKFDSLKTAFRSLTVNLFLNKYFVSKNQMDLATKYDSAALADVQNIAKLLYEKLPPAYPTIEEK